MTNTVVITAVTMLEIWLEGEPKHRSYSIDRNPWDLTTERSLTGALEIKIEWDDGEIRHRVFQQDHEIKEIALMLLRDFS